SALHVTGLDDLAHDRTSEIDGHREAVARVVARRALDRAVDADDFTLHVHKRTTRVAGIDRGVRLDEVLNRLLRLASKLKRTALRADDALRHGEGQVLAERIANREHPLADARRLAVAERRSGQVVRIDLDDGDVRVRIAADDSRLELAPIEETHGYFGRA